MVKRGELPEPTTAAHIAKLSPKFSSGKTSEAACRDPAKAKYRGQCCSGSRVWGDFDAQVYLDGSRNSFAVFCCGACKLPLPLPSAALVSSPVTLTGAQKATIEQKRQAALARKRAREEASAPPLPPPPPPRPADAVELGAIAKVPASDSDWVENTVLPHRYEFQSPYWKLSCKNNM